MARPRIFGIGLSKTGTHSLNEALTVLGFPSIHYPDPGLMLAGRFEEALAGYRAGTDISIAAFYRELDRRYPGSRFILTLREIDGWLESVGDHCRRREHQPPAPNCPKAELRRIVYGSATFDSETYRHAYERHQEEVESFFENRPGDLLVLNICGGQGWEELCAFLGVDSRGGAFPDLNKRRRISAA